MAYRGMATESRAEIAASDVAPAPDNSLWSAPGRRLTRVDWAIAATLGFVSLLYLWIFRALFQWDPDEGIILQGAVRILHGEIPYRDFFSFYTPGSYYWNALLLRVFGESLLVPRTALVAYGALFSASTYLLSRKMSNSRQSSTFVSLLLLISCLPVRFIVLHNWDSTAAGLACLCSAILLVHRRGIAASLSTGFFAALTLLFNQARGAGLIFGLALGLALLQWRLRSMRLRKQDLVAIVSGITLPVVFTMAYLARQGALPEFISSMSWPMNHYSGANRLPFGFVIMSQADVNALFLSGPLPMRALRLFFVSPAVILSALPVFVVLVAAACVIKPRRDLSKNEQGLTILSGSIVLGSLITAVVSRPDFHHLTFLMPLYAFLLPWVLDRWAAPFRSFSAARDLVVLYFLLAFTAYGLTVLMVARNATVPLQTRRGLLRTGRPNQTIPFVQEHIPPGSKLLVHPYFPLYSFLTATTSPVRYEYLQPGMHSLEEFNNTQRELAEHPPEAVLLEPLFTYKIPTAWPHTRLSDIVRDPVTDFITHNYVVCRILDYDSPATFLFMARKDLGCAKILH